MDGMVSSTDGQAEARAVGAVLRRALDKLVTLGAAPDGVIGSERFRHCWTQHTQRPAIPTQILQFAEEVDALQVLLRTSLVIRDLRFPRPIQLSAQDVLLKDLLLAIALIAAVRRVQKKAPSSSIAAGQVEIPMAELLAASVVACAWLDVPLSIRYDTSRSGPYPDNVLANDHAPIEFDHADGSALGVMKQELEKFLSRYFGSIEWSMDSLTAGLQLVRDSFHTAPVVALRHNDEGHPLSNAAQRQAFVEQFGVPVFIYGHSEQSQAMQELEKELKGHFQKSICDLLRTHTDDEETSPMTRTKVFISYAHEDEQWRETMRKVLKSLERRGQLDVWDDRRLRTGDAWRKEIETALSGCGIAILLVTLDFLNSDFINDIELVRIFERHENEGLWIYPVLIGPCDWEGDDQLKARQMKLCNGQPFKKASEADQEEAFAEVAKEIRERLSGTGK